jgi:hypothetical protein
MYGLPRNFDLSFLHGRRLQMLCFNANQIYLHFDHAVTITIEGSYSLQRNRIEVQQVLSVPRAEPTLLQLIEHTLAGASSDDGRTLALTFDDGALLKLYDDEKYESYKIQRGPSVTIV